MKMIKKKSDIVNELEEIKKIQITTNNRLLILCEDVRNMPDDEVKNMFNMKVGQKYYFIGDEGDVVSAIWTGEYRDHLNIIHNCASLTKEECEFKKDRNYLIYEIAAWQFEFDPFVVDWEDTSQYKSFFFYSHKYDRIEYNSCIQMQNNDWLYFSSSKKAHQCVESIGTERIKKYLFKVGV